jgi:hypothetical protein
MSGARQGRRAFLTTAAAAAGVASIGRASAAGTEGSATDGLENACSRDDTGQETGTFPIDVPSVETPDPTEETEETEGTEGTEAIEAIDVTVTDSGNEGPTAFILGGIHGDEEAGIIAAQHITNWDPSAGQIAVLPEANPLAIEDDSRTNAYGDLNRKFDFGEIPATALARTIWQALEASDPDVVMTLQESQGIYGGSPSGVGQAVFRSPGDDTYDAASMGVRRANRTIGRQELKFDIGHITGPGTAPTGLLTEKAAYQAGIPSFIVETYEEVNLEARVRWQEKIVSGVLDYYDLY